MSYLSHYDGIIRLDHPTLTPQSIADAATRLCATIGDGWLDPDQGITRISADPADTTATTRHPHPCKAVIAIEPDGEETWYRWREHLDQLRQALASQGIDCHGTVYRHSDESASPDYERLTITPEACASQTAWPVFPDGEQW